MSIRVGAGPLIRFNDDFGFFRNDVVREAHLTALHRAGFDGVCLNPGTPREVAAVHAALARHGLAYIAPTHAIDLTRRSAKDVFADLQLPVRATRSLGARDLSLFEEPCPHMDDAAWQRWGVRLGELAARFADHDVRLVYRPMAGSIICDAPSIDRLMAATPASVRLMLDVALVGDAFVGLAEQYASRIAIVAPGADHDDVLAHLPDFAGWTLLDTASDHSTAHLTHLHALAA
jgi:sugar phosphate isomerase/epimerase